MTGRQYCESPHCTQQAVTWVPETSAFACEQHAPVGSEFKR